MKIPEIVFVVGEKDPPCRHLCGTVWWLRFTEGEEAFQRASEQIGFVQNCNTCIFAQLQEVQYF